jgi:hypothetical protein
MDKYTAGSTEEGFSILTSTVQAIGSKCYALAVGASQLKQENFELPSLMMESSQK